MPSSLTTCNLAVAVLALLSLPTAEAAFTAFTTTPQQARPQCMALNLLPTQGSQLVAASNTIYHGKDDDQEEEEDGAANVSTLLPSQTQAKPTTTTATSAARAFVSRVFSLPSTMIKRHPHPDVEGIQVDVVYHPIVGFQYVKDAPHHCKALPTISNPSCRLLNRAEPVYGWFSPACRVDDEADAGTTSN